MANVTGCVAACKYGGDVKKKQGKKDMIRCCICMVWHHGDCLPRDEETGGIWNCPNCRLLPRLFADMKNSHSKMQEELRSMAAKQCQLMDEIRDVKKHCLKLQDENRSLLAKLEKNRPCIGAVELPVDNRAIDKDAASQSWSHVVEASLKKALRDEQSRSEIMDIPTRPSAVVRMGKDGKKAPRPVKRPCRGSEEQVRYLKQKEETWKLNDNAKKNGVHESESFSLRNNGEIWKYIKHNDGKWKRVAEWKRRPTPQEGQDQGQIETDTGNTAAVAPSLKVSVSNPRDAFLNDLQDILKCLIVKPKSFIILGDFNIHWDVEADRERMKLLDMAEAFQLVQHVTGATHRDGHTIDLILSRDGDNLVADAFHGLQISDHRAVHFSINAAKPHPPRKKITFRKLRNVVQVTLKRDLREAVATISINPPDEFDAEAWLRTGLTVHHEMFKRQKNFVTALIGQTRSKFYCNKIEECQEKMSDFFMKKIRDIWEELQCHDDGDEEMPFGDPVSRTPPKLEVLSPAGIEEVVRIIKTMSNATCDLDPMPTSLVKQQLDVLAPLITAVMLPALIDSMDEDLDFQNVLNPYESFMRKHLQHYGYYTGKNASFRNGFPGFEEWRQELMLTGSSQDDDDDDKGDSCSQTDRTQKRHAIDLEMDSKSWWAKEDEDTGNEDHKLGDLPLHQHPMWRDASSLKELSQFLADIDFFNNVGSALFYWQPVQFSQDRRDVRTLITDACCSGQPVVLSLLPLSSISEVNACSETGRDDLGTGGFGDLS
ncbi:hypothetical protein CAPTEDRAFT_193703 [Capitella teleta]|uniref:Zinc finger PHD-type domain-containing protein n=1 Tax=Capitella teleta TaxID=283909 RepID=R7T7W9_CAPTE|nr:hypothetical protein CAPTEDRAFT_193703 [Capitella teleta]|eukprot:ELT89710.1 hypothetical protein CAPTEDRAFT_193703 [Capitella teleta]